MNYVILCRIIDVVNSHLIKDKLCGDDKIDFISAIHFF